MAHVYQLPSGKWRAQVSRQGVRKTRTFGTKEDAEHWGKGAEARILAKAPMFDNKLAARLLQSVPRRVLQAIKDAPFKREDIASDPIEVVSASGVYFLIKREEIVYVGKSTNIFRRIGKHIEEGRRFDAFNVIYAPQDKIAEIERLYLNALVPPWNHTLEGRAPD